MFAQHHRQEAITPGYYKSFSQLSIHRNAGGTFASTAGADASSFPRGISPPSRSEAVDIIRVPPGEQVTPATGSSAAQSPGGSSRRRKNLPRAWCTLTEVEGCAAHVREARAAEVCADD
ncbi:hypothetical protein MRX96_044349 [Rhipicephalus microplus]